MNNDSQLIKVSYYPGCSLDSSGREYGESTEAVARDLQVELGELPDWNCCGATSGHATNERLDVLLSARNLWIAEKAGRDLVVPCAACFQRLKTAEKRLLEGPEKEEIPIGYQGKIRIRHLADFLWEDVGPKKIREKVRKPLAGLKPVCYYGCLTVRPPRVTGARDPEDPKVMDNILKILGARVMNWSYKTDCCGGSLVLTRPDIVRRLVGKLLENAEEAGADCVVTACPLCQANLDGQQDEAPRASGKKPKMPVFYFTELMGLAFQSPEARGWWKRHLTDPRKFLKEKGLI
jgi:heterodisulfide reductase subunit B